MILEGGKFMLRHFKKIIAIFVIALIINFTVFQVKKAESVALIDDVAVIGLVALTLAAVGVYSNNKDSMNDAAVGAWNSFSASTKSLYQNAKNQSLAYLVLSDASWSNITDYSSSNYTAGTQTINKVVTTNTTAGAIVDSTYPGPITINGHSLSAEYGGQYGSAAIVNFYEDGLLLSGDEHVLGNESTWMNNVSYCYYNGGLAIHMFYAFGGGKYMSCVDNVTSASPATITANKSLTYNNDAAVSSPGDFINHTSVIASLADRRIAIPAALYVAGTLGDVYNNFVQGKTMQSVRQDAAAYPSDNIYDAGTNTFNLPTYVASVDVVPIVPATYTPNVTTVDDAPPSIDSPPDTLSGIASICAAMVSIWTLLQTGFNNVCTSVANAIGDAVNSLNSGLTDILNNVKSVSAVMSAFFTNCLNSIGQLITGMSSLWTATTHGFSTIADYLNGVLDKVANITDWLNPYSDTFILKVAFVPTLTLADSLATIQTAINTKLPFAWFSNWAAAASSGYGGDNISFWWTPGLSGAQVGFDMGDVSGVRGFSTIIIAWLALWAGYGEIRRFIG
jgi:hypothetical protein